MMVHPDAVNEISSSSSSSSSSSNNRDEEQAIVDDDICPVCYDTFEVEDADETAEENVVEVRNNSDKRRIQVETCQHAFCLKCLQEYCQYKLSIHKVPISCPMTATTTTTTTTAARKNNDKNDAEENASCAQVLSDETVKNILTSSDTSSRDDWVKFLRLQRLADDPSLVSCPRCSEVVLPNKEEEESIIELQQEQQQQIPPKEVEAASNDSNRRSCPACFHSFCAVHGDGHLGMTCEEYMLSLDAQQQQQTEVSLRIWTRPCSHCGAAIFKAAGCDHVICAACHQDMCFRCGTHLYLSGTAIRSCAKCKQGFFDHRYNRQFRLNMCLCVPFLLPGWILYSVVVGAVALLSGCFGCCFLCGLHKKQRQRESSITRQQRSESTRQCAPWRGIRQGFFLIFLPFLMFLRDLGLNCGCLDVDELFASGIEEIPSLPTVDESDHYANSE